MSLNMFKIMEAKPNMFLGIANTILAYCAFKICHRHAIIYFERVFASKNKFIPAWAKSKLNARLASMSLNMFKIMEAKPNMFLGIANTILAYNLLSILVSPQPIQM